jgi:hypothetical protein
MNRKNAQNISPSTFGGSGVSTVAPNPIPSSQHQTPAIGTSSPTGQTLQGRVVSSRQGTSPSVEEIRTRAFQIFLARNGRNGTPESDWLQAERELRAGRTAR